MSGRDKLAGLAVFIVALVLRVAYIHENETVLGLDVSKLTQTDNHVFAQWARIIADGDLLCREQPHAYHLWTRDVAPEDRWLEWYGGASTFHQAPLYPYFVAGVYALFGRDHETVGYAQAVLSALTCLLTWWLARRLISPLGGLVAGLLLACMGSFYFYDAWILRDGPMALLVIVLALALDRAVRRGRALDWLGAGAAFGLFTLAKETGTPMLALTLALMACVWRRQPARLVRCSALLLAGFFLLTTPAYLRNREVGAPTFKLSTRGPEVFVTGNARGQDGVGWDPPTALLREILMESNFRLAPTIALTLATHRADPLGFLKLLGHKTWAFFNAYEIPNNVDFEMHRAHLTTLRLGFVSMWFLGPAALLGLLIALPRRREFVVPYALFVVVAGSVIGLYVLGRFRVQALPLLAFFAAVTVDWAVRALRRRAWAPLAVAVLPFGLLLDWSARPSAEQIPVYDASNRDAAIMLKLVKAGDFERALRFREQLLHTIETTRDDLDGDENLAWKLDSIRRAFDAFAEAGRYSNDAAGWHLHVGEGYTELLAVTKRGERVEFANLARREFEIAHELDPELPGTLLGIGKVYFHDNDLGQAYHWIRKELDAREDNVEAHVAAGLIMRTWKQDREALRHLRSAIDLGHEDARVLVYAGFIMINAEHRDAQVRLGGEGHPAHDPPLALRYALRALELEPEDEVVRETAAYILYANDRFDEAVALLDGLAEELPARAAELRELAARFLLIKADKADQAPAAPAPSEPGS